MGARGGHGHHPHHHGHGALHHGPAQGTPRRRHRRRLAAALALGAVVLVAEVVAGFVANSLALLSDAAHYFADVSSIGLALWAVSLALRPATRCLLYTSDAADE